MKLRGKSAASLCFCQPVNANVRLLRPKGEDRVIPPTATLVAAILIGLAALHGYWAAGGRRGIAAAAPTGPDGQPVFRPGPAGTLAVAVALAVAALLVLMQAQVVPFGSSSALTHGGAWAVGGAFALRAVGDFRYVGVLRRVKDTAFASRDRALYTPLCAGLAVAILWLAAH